MANKEALTGFHREAISGVAEELFQEKGFAATTMDDIAQKASYSKATLYVHFKSKEQIYHYLQLKAMRMLYERIKTGLSFSSDALEQYWALCKEFRTFSEEHPFYYQSLSETIATDEQSRKKDPLLDSIYEMGERVNGLVQTMLDNGVRQGYFRQGLPGIPAGVLYGSMLFSAIQLAENKSEYLKQHTGMSKNDFLQFAFDTMLRGLLQNGRKADEKD
jgi:AcrR family transcriptional regulator